MMDLPVTLCKVSVSAGGVAPLFNAVLSMMLYIAPGVSPEQVPIFLLFETLTMSLLASPSPVQFIITVL